MDSWDERHESWRTGWMKQAPKRRKDEDLLTYYPHLQYEKKRCLCANQNADPLLRSDSEITEIHISKEIIRKRESNGRFTKKEVILIDEHTEYCRPVSPENHNLTDATSLVQEQGRQAASRGSTHSQSIDFSVPSGDRPTSKSPARRAEPTDLCHLAEDMEILQQFIRKYEPRGAHISKEKIVIFSEDNNDHKARSSMYPYRDGDSNKVDVSTRW